MEPDSTSPERASNPAGGATIIVFSSDLDKLLAAFTIATGAAAMGACVSMFFTFWGLYPLKRRTILAGKTPLQKVLAAIVPSGLDRAGPSKFRCLGLGRWLFKVLMRQQKMMGLRELIALARDLNVRMTVCQSSMEVMGIQKHELIDGLEYGGLANFLSAALNARINLFI
jgi:peroxiredoxin family protein